MMTRLLAATALLTSACATSQTLPMPRTSSHVANWPACGSVDSFPGENWQAADPAAAGWNTSALAEARTLFEAGEGAAVMVVHRGVPVASWGSVEVPYTAQSVRKALVSSLAGQLIDEGRIGLGDTLEELGIDDDPPLAEAERQATFEHLLLSRSGIMHSALYEVGGWKAMRAELAERKQEQGGFAPGDYWVYNNWDFNAVGTILEEVGGAPLGDLFSQRIAAPLGMQDFRPASVEYTTRDHPAERRFDNNSDHRAYVFDISTRDLARYGLLYLNCGSWNGAQIVPEDWVHNSIDGIDTSLGRPADESYTGFADYGYLWQIDRPGNRRYTGLPTIEPVYFATGNRGHLMMVAPFLDLVVAVQPATVGGVGFEAQRRRAMEGSPEINDSEMEALLRAIVAAHPDAGSAFE